MEIERLREELESANLEKERLHDEREEMVNQYEEEFDRRKQELLDENQAALNDVRESQAGQIETLSHQLDQMHRAFSGDPCGWKEKTDRKTGKKIFVNDETGEQEKEKVRGRAEEHTGWRGWLVCCSRPPRNPLF